MKLQNYIKSILNRVDIPKIFVYLISEVSMYKYVHLQEIQGLLEEMVLKEAKELMAKMVLTEHLD